MTTEILGAPTRSGSSSSTKNFLSGSSPPHAQSRRGFLLRGPIRCPAGQNTRGVVSRRRGYGLFGSVSAPQVAGRTRNTFDGFRSLWIIDGELEWRYSRPLAMSCAARSRCCGVRWETPSLYSLFRKKMRGDAKWREERDQQKALGSHARIVTTPHIMQAVRCSVSPPFSGRAVFPLRGKTAYHDLSVPPAMCSAMIQQCEGRTREAQRNGRMFGCLQ